MSSEGVTALLLDREANLWVGGLRGLHRIGSQRFSSYTPNEGLLENEVSAIAEPAPGELLFGHNSGLTRLVGERVEALSFEHMPVAPLGARRVLDIAVDRGGQTWLAAHELGLLRLIGSRVETVLAGNASSVEVDARGSLWVLSDNRLWVGDGSSAGFSPVDLASAGSELRYLRWLTAADDRLYVSTRQGLLWRGGLGGASGEDSAWHLARGAGIASNNVYGVLPAPEGGVWVGTEAGLMELRGQQLVPVGRGALRLERPVYFILEDRRGWRWLGTDDGVWVWDGERLRQLTVRHGLAGREANRGAALVDHRGRVWIGTDQGMSVYREPYDAGPAAPPSVELRSVEVAGEPQPADRPLELVHDRNTLSFRVDTIAFSHEEEVLYRYRLEGFEEGWQGPEPFASQGIRYTNLEPGRYRFRAAAGWAGQSWGEEAASAEIVIAPPLWRQPWFLALVALAGAGSILGLHGLRTRVLRARAIELGELNLRLGEVAQERQRLIAELEARNAELERFTYTVSHDLKSPLITIKGFLGLLGRDAAAGDAERLRHDVERIGAAADTMGSLLDELLELSRIGRVVNPSEEVDLTELAHEAAESVAGELAERRIEVDIAADLPTVTGDRLRLLEVLQNLLANAARFMGEQPAPRVEIGVRHEGGEAVITVRDNGIGIDPRYHERVFGLFERLDARAEGTGIGLALVKRIVEFHGGRIWVESEGAGRGSTFCFPLVREGPERRVDY